MSTIIDLKTARYKGVEFLFEQAPTTGGNRIIKYNFPGSDKQSVERQGKLPRTFTLTIIIPSDGYYQKRDALLAVLEDGRRGVLTHPTFGDIDNVINGPYTLSEKLTELGRATVQVAFEVDSTPGVPLEGGVSATVVAQRAEEANAIVDAGFAAAFKAETINFDDAVGTVTSVSRALNAAAASTVGTTAARVSDFSASVVALADNAGSLVTSPADLVGSVASLFEGVQRLYDTPETLMGAVRLLLSFGSSDVALTGNNSVHIARNRNRAATRGLIRARALSLTYTAAAQRSYEDTLTLEADLAEMDVTYISLRANEQITNEALEAIDRLRISANTRLDQSRVSARSTVVINTHLRPLSALVYEYYGSTELLGVISKLNDVHHHAFVEGDITVLAA